MRAREVEDKRDYASVNAGFIGQNVYLFCASEGLATVFRAALNYDRPAQVLRLNDGQFVTFAQTVDGFPPANRSRRPCPVAGRRATKYQINRALVRY